jgi:small subunit ribosomal protein S2
MSIGRRHYSKGFNLGHFLERRSYNKSFNSNRCLEQCIHSKSSNLGHFSERRLHSKSLNLGHFLERRPAFFDNIKNEAKQNKTQKAQSKLLDMLSSIGSAVSPQAGLGIDSESCTSQTARDSVTIKQMIECSMHLGHATFKWNPKMAPFIFGERAGIHIIDLEKTIIALRQACAVVTDIASKGGAIVFVGTGENIQRLTYECAQECGQYYVNVRWVGGTITNRNQVLRSDKLTADLLIILDPATNEKAVLEAEKGCIPTIAICDTNFDPTTITYPIPANDDSFSSVELIARTLSLAAEEGRRARTRPTKSAEIIESATSFIDRVFTRT